MSLRARITTSLGVSAGVALALGPGLAAAPASATTISPVFERTIGGPGHAGLYAWGMATQLDGTILVGDYWNYRVLRFNADGTPVGPGGVFIKNNGNGANQYYTPYGLGIDPSNGDVYMADTDKYQIDVYSKDGAFLRSWGAKGTGPGKFLYPSRVVVNSLGTVFTADTWDHNIVMSDRNGTEIKQFGTWGVANGQMKSPHGLALDASDNLYVVDTGNWRIDVFDKNGTFVRTWGTKGSKLGQFQGDMRGIAVDKVNGWVYVVDGEGNRVNKYDLMGNFITRWGSLGSGPGQFADGGREVTVDQQGNVWVADMPNFRVQKFSPTGAALMQYPNPAQPPVPGGFNAPRSVAVNATDGTVAVSDTYNWRIETFTNAGTFTKEWGGRGRGPYLFNYARTVASNPVNGDWIITDTDNGRIAAYTKDGVYKWSTGTAGKGGLGQFRNPQSVTVAPDGTIYVTDSNNQRIQVLDSVLYINDVAVPRVRVEDYVDPSGEGHGTPIPQYRETLPNGVSYNTLDITPTGDADNTPVYEVPEGHYFMMGDNRDNSQDSRYLNVVGYVPIENYVGRADIIFFSISPNAVLWKPWEWPFLTRWTRFFNLI